MPLDGIFLHFLSREIEEKALGARVEKIAQPSREELVLQLRGKTGTHKLLLCGGASNPRLHFVDKAPENPQTPPMFCMLLRKRLGGARLIAVRQIGLDRILQIDFAAHNELGDPVGLTVAIEIMGRHSNVMVMEEDRKILDCLRRVDIETSRVRQVLPGMRYVLPPTQNKINLLEHPPEDVIAALQSRRDISLEKALMEQLEGFSTLACREAVHFAARGADITVGEMTPQQAERLTFYLREVRGLLCAGSPNPVMVLEKEGRPRDFSALQVRQYGASMLVKEYAGCSALLESFFAERDRVERIRQRSGDLLTLLANFSERAARRVAAQREELEQCKSREQLKQKGDLISANIYGINKGDTVARVQNFYAQDGAEIDIELDPFLAPAQNAQRYYTLYRKADTAEKHLTARIAQGEEEIAYLDSVFDALTRAEGSAELDAIRNELASGGYLRRAATAKKAVKEQKLPPLRYRSSDGFIILCGRNNVQNDTLTLKEAKKTDLWLHTKIIAGSHVIIQTRGEEVPERTIHQAAAIAAYNSKGRDSSKVPVDYCPVRNVRKPSGAKPGMVIYDSYRTILADPDKELVGALVHV